MADDRIDALAADLEALKVEFERYFLGLEKRMPASSREQLERAIRRYTPGNDAVEKFRYQGLVQRLYAYQRYWNRILRAIEEGTYERDRFKADYRAQKRAEDKAAAPSVEAEARASTAARAVGDEAEAFLASLTGGRPASTSGSMPAVGLRGRPVGDRPSVDTREQVRSSITPGDGVPTAPRGRPMPRRSLSSSPAPTPTPAPTPREAPLPMRGAPKAAPSAPPPPMRGVPRSASSAPAPSAPAPSARPSLPGARPSPPSMPPSARPSPPSARPSLPNARPSAPAPSARPSLPGAQPSAPTPAPMRGAPKAPPPLPMRGAPKAPPPLPMRGAPKAPPPVPLRGRPRDEE